MTVAYRGEVWPEGLGFTIRVRAEGDGIVGDMIVDMRPGDVFEGWSFEALLERGPGPFPIPHPRWTDWADTIVAIPRDLAELIQLVEHLRDKLRQGIRQPESADLARHLAESAHRLGYAKASSALRRCTSACEAGAGGVATADVVAALRSLRSAR